MGEKKQANGGEGKDVKKQDNKDGDGITVVLKSDLHCEGCASKLIKSIRSISGVEMANFTDNRKIRVIGYMDPAEVREKVEQKAHQKVELMVPDQLKSGGKSNGDKNKNESKNEKKSKEPPVTTVVLKVKLHCEGCVSRIQKTVTKTKGFKEMKIDQKKDLVMVTGSMDMKALAELLQKQLKKDVVIVPPPPKKKEEEKQEKPEDKMEMGNKMPQMGGQMFGYGPYPFTFGPGMGGGPAAYQAPQMFSMAAYHAPQMFSDENPNACSIV